MSLNDRKWLKRGAHKPCARSNHPELRRCIIQYVEANPDMYVGQWCKIATKP